MQKLIKVQLCEVHMENRDAYKQRYEGYSFKIITRSFNPENDLVDVALIMPDDHKYYANFVTPSYFTYLFNKNKKTGECAGGTYFCMPDNMVVVEMITEETISKTIEDLIKNEEIEHYFHQ